jgi:hypothetical protein
MRILDFQKFSKIYEAEEATGAMPEQGIAMLRRLATLYFTCYGSLASLTKGYDGIVKDLTGLIAAPQDKKIEKLKAIAEAIGSQVRDEFKKDGVDKAWVAAADKTADGFAALMDQYKDDKEVIDEVVSIINKMVTSYIENLKRGKNEADSKISEGSLYESEQLFEGWFTTKKGNIKNLMSQAVATKANLKTASEDAGLKTLALKLISEVDGLINRLGELSTLKRSDVKEEELQTISAKLNEIPLAVNKETEKLSKSNTANKEAALIYLEANDLAEVAIDKEMKVKEALAKEAEDKLSQENKAKDEAAKLKISRDIDPLKIKATEKNPDVQKFQTLVIEKFKDYAPVADTDLFKKFVKFGADGKFGGTTKGIVASLKAGFGLDDTGLEITQELVDELYKFDPKNPEAKNESKIASFDSFSAIYEFDTNKFTEVSKGASPVKQKASGPVDVKADVKDDSATQSTQDQIADEVKKALDKEKVSRLVNKLKKLDVGLVEPKDKSDGAILVNNAIRVFGDGTYYRPRTGVRGDLKPLFGNDFAEKVELEDKLKDELGFETTLKKVLTSYWGARVLDLVGKLNYDIEVNMAGRSEDLYKNLMKLSPTVISSVAKCYKGSFKTGLLSSLDREWTNTDNIRKFTRKFAKELEKYDE